MAERHGRSAITSYIGNPVAHAFSLSRYVGLFVGLAQLECLYSAGTIDQWPKNVSSMLLYGNMWTIPTPDLERTDHLVIMGGNPQASGGSLLACADVLAKMDAIRERGGKVVVIDPRRTGTAERADEWVPIVPGTDAALLMAVAHVLFADGLVDPASVHPLVDHVDTIGDLVADWSPERVAATCGVPAGTIRRLAHELAGAPTAALYGRIGTCNQEFGTLASWLVDVINVLTGNFDRPGGLMLAKPVAWGVSSLDDPQWADGVSFGRWRSRVGDVPEVLGQLPVGLLAEEILDGGDRAWKALVTIAGNPVISSTNPHPPGPGARHPRLHDQRGQLPQRDHAPRPRPPARSGRVGAAPLRRPDPGLGGALRRQLLPRRDGPAGRATPASGGCWPPWGRCCWAWATTRSTWTTWTTGTSARCARPRAWTPPPSCPCTPNEVRSGCWTCRSAPASSVTATASIPGA